MRLSALLLAAQLQLTLAAAPAPKTSGPRRGIDDSLNRTPAADLGLRPENTRKAEALAAFVEGARLEENAEIDNALNAYLKVLTVDPGQSELAARVATLLTRQQDFPRAVDVLKDAIKANPKEAASYLQLAFIYAKYLHKNDQALKYANQAIAIEPKNIEGYQRLYEVQLAAGDPRKALPVLDHAKSVKSDDAQFWAHLGKLYASITLKPDSTLAPEDMKRVNEFFEKALQTAADNPTVLKDVADYYAASQQIQQAIPLYLRVLELQPDDSNAREKLATGFILTNQRPKAIEMLQEIIQQHPEKYQSYDLLAQLLDDDARALVRAKKIPEAKMEFAKAAANYEQSILINPAHVTSYLRLADLLIGPVRNPERAIKVLTDARRRFPDAPEFTYFLGLAQREAKHPEQAIATFEEALHEAETSSAEFINARFYFDYAVAADQAGFHDKAADLLRQAIAIDPANSAEAYNYLAYMWAEQNAHLDEAEEAVKHALDFDPNNGAFLDTLGWIHFRKGKYEDGLRELLQAERNMQQSDAVVLEHIGDTYAKLNRIPQALDYWEKALTLDTGNKALAGKIESTKTKISKGPALKVDPAP
ncbi:MAG: tetratricopeptide repeat protein [Chthoniobacterales bacterium]